MAPTCCATGWSGAAPSAPPAALFDRHVVGDGLRRRGEVIVGLAVFQAQRLLAVPHRRESPDFEAGFLVLRRRTLGLDRPDLRLAQAPLVARLRLERQPHE